MLESTRFFHVAALAVALTFAPGVTATAQTTSKEPAKAAEQAKPAPTPAKILVPDANGLLILINNAIIALNQANLVDNYTVLRDLGAPAFQKANSAQKLASIFANMRERHLNLSPLLLYQPKLVQPAAIDDKGFLRLTGFYETEPFQIHFNLVFQAVAGFWRLMEISVWTAVVP
jgi:Tfp pilus assembly protein FimV